MFVAVFRLRGIAMGFGTAGCELQRKMPVLEWREHNLLVDGECTYIFFFLFHLD